MCLQKSQRVRLWLCIQGEWHVFAVLHSSFSQRVNLGSSLINYLNKPFIRYNTVSVAGRWECPQEIQ